MQEAVGAEVGRRSRSYAAACSGPTVICLVWAALVDIWVDTCVDEQVLEDLTEMVRQSLPPSGRERAKRCAGRLARL